MNTNQNTGIPPHHPPADRQSTPNRRGARCISGNEHAKRCTHLATRPASGTIVRARPRRIAETPAGGMSVELRTETCYFHTFQQIDLRPSVHSLPPCSACKAARRSEGVSWSRKRVSHLFLRGQGQTSQLLTHFHTLDLLRNGGIYLVSSMVLISRTSSLEDR